MRQASLEDLVRWLSLGFGDETEPIFAVGSHVNEPLGASVNESMRDLWREVMGRSGEPMSGEWEQCAYCGTWHVNSLLTD
jgi:hypothetical protein